MTQLQLRGQLRAYVISAHTACSLSGPVFASQEHLFLLVRLIQRDITGDQSLYKRLNHLMGVKENIVSSGLLGKWVEAHCYIWQKMSCLCPSMTYTSHCVLCMSLYVLNLKSTWCIFHSCYSIPHSWIKFPVLYYKTIMKNVYFKHPRETDRQVSWGVKVLNSLWTESWWFIRLK